MHVHQTNLSLQTQNNVLSTHILLRDLYSTLTLTFFGSCPPMATKISNTPLQTTIPVKLIQPESFSLSSRLTCPPHRSCLHHLPGQSRARPPLPSNHERNENLKRRKSRYVSLTFFSNMASKTSCSWSCKRSTIRVTICASDHLFIQNPTSWKGRCSSQQHAVSRAAHLSSGVQSDVRTIRVSVSAQIHYAGYLLRRVIVGRLKRFCTHYIQRKSRWRQKILEI